MAVAIHFRPPVKRRGLFIIRERISRGRWRFI
ncbi:FimH [Escherichia coli P12b]|nr:FimH [Escherichia coli P12b]